MSPRNERYEALMRETGQFGHFQRRLCALLVLSSVPNGYFALSMVFVGRTPSLRCLNPDLGNWNLPQIGVSNEGFYVLGNASGNQELFNNSLLRFDDGCPKYLNASYPSNSNVADSGCPNGYVYDFEEGRTSIVTEWNLVCDRAWMKPLIMSIYMGGVLIGSLIGGALADKFGRYPTFMSGTVFMFIFLGLCGVSSSPIMFSVFLFFAGLFGFINYIAAFIISAEVINTKDRVLTGTLTVGGFAVGYMLLPLFAYFIGDWRILCFALASTGVIFIPYFWLITESPRWLFSKGRKDDFSKLFLKIAETNGLTRERAKEMVEHCFSDLDSSPETSLLNDDLADTKLETDAVAYHAVEYSYLDLLRTSIVLPRTLCMWFIWFVCSVVYYCVAFNTSNMGGNPYTNCFIAAAVEIPAYAIVIILLKWQGRKPILSSSLLVAGLTCAAVPYFETISSGLAVASAMIGKFAVSGAFNIVFIVCCELFPTLMRSMGVGSSSMAARVGGMVAPYLLYLGDHNHYAPYLIMGLLGVAGAATNLVLPETKESVMPETMDDLKPISCARCLISKPQRSKPQDSSC